uniref:Putative ubinuclein nuclear protein n=1 Tax=Ornithodoros turicata TaxID=34597 RepID=A0A2R5LEE0_9ACAR
MAEARRVQLQNAHQVPNKKKSVDNSPTKRFSLTLGESTADSCPEFSYSDLLKCSREPAKAKEDPFDEDVDKMREIARQLEERYGPKPTGKKKHKGGRRWEDYIDRGMGYDETDPFIDNEEAYDELVPSTLTTKHGGFYINTGELEFRDLSGSDEDDFKGEPRQRKRRRRRAEGADVPPRKEGNRGRKPAAVPPPVRESAPVEDPVKASSSSNSSGGVNNNAVATEEEGAAARPALPENLPTDLEEVVKRLKQAAHLSGEGKCKFFRGPVNQMLLSVELRARELGPAQRSSVFAHLASFLPCTKETLLKRAKKLRLDQEDGKLREPLRRLREAVAERIGTPAGGSTGTATLDDQLRELLCDAVRIKLRCYEVSKMRTQSAEDYLRHFLDAEVRTLWPEGVITARTLLQESSTAHSYLTSKPRGSKPAPLPPPASTPPTTATTSVTPNPISVPTSICTPSPAPLPVSPSTSSVPTVTPNLNATSPLPQRKRPPPEAVPEQSPKRPEDPGGPFLASHMLDRIIAASLGNFPSSSTSEPTRPVHEPPVSSSSLPLQSYAFLEAFKRSLEEGPRVPPTARPRAPEPLEGMKGFPYPAPLPQYQGVSRTRPVASDRMQWRGAPTAHEASVGAPRLSQPRYGYAEGLHGHPYTRPAHQGAPPPPSRVP